ncbi:MAG: helix-hairpin-helix domain-containing protein [Taibaiella sp.]|nr:helix-hairpin-helix domain-containing protein [Taibaiella sp.]
MNNLFRSYISFNRTERMGIIALLSVIIILIAVRASMHLWVKQPEIHAEQVIVASKQISNQPIQQTQALPPGEKINMNTADSLTLISLPGIGKGLSHRILERRRQLGRFTDMQQVYDVYHFNEKTKKMLNERTTIE